MKKVTFKVTATISKLITVEMPEEEYDNVEDMIEGAREEAYEMFNPNADGQIEDYQENSMFIKIE